MKRYIEILQKFAQEEGLVEVAATCSILLMVEAKQMNEMDFELLLLQIPGMIKEAQNAA